jgi:NADH:ubiquinone oxidoreductase subunit 6 (subunit J)
MTRSVWLTMITLKTRSVVIIFESCKATKQLINHKSQTCPHIISKRNAIIEILVLSYHWVVNCTCICLLEGFVGGIKVSKWL